MANGIQTNKIVAFRQDTVPFIDVQASMLLDHLALEVSDIV